MFAIAAAVIFALDLLLDLIDSDRGDLITHDTLIAAGLLCVALHLAGVGATWRSRRRR